MPALAELRRHRSAIRQVRHRGTIGGSIANNDPTADYPAACSASAPPSSPTSASIAADDFFTGMFETALEPDEIITKVSFPIAKKAAYEKFQQPGLALCAGRRVRRRSAASEIRVAVTGAGANGVFRVQVVRGGAEEALPPKSLEGMTIPADGMNSDIHGSAEYRAHLVGVLARRAVARARRSGRGRRSAYALRGTDPTASCPALCRACASWAAWLHDRDGRDRLGHDGVSCRP